MPRQPRADPPGGWHHVMNRGIARRVAFPDRAHIRHFLALVALAIRRREIEVHAFCVMTTHFHMLVRSTRGKMSEALRRIQNEYVRYYNRRRPGRDGALFRGRFHSRPVLSLAYRDLLVRYIEHNPVKAGLVRRAEDYPYSSAALQARPTRPPWLATWWTDEILASVQRIDPAATYASLWGEGLTPAEGAVVDARLERPAPAVDALDDLVGAATPQVRAWMEAQARLADGQGARPILVDAATVLLVLASARRAGSGWTAQARCGPPCDLWAVATAALLRRLGGLTQVEIAAQLKVTAARAAQFLLRHRGQMQDAGYADRVASLAVECLGAAHPPRPVALRLGAPQTREPLSRRV